MFGSHVIKGSARHGLFGPTSQIFQDPLHGSLADSQTLSDIATGEPLGLQVENRPAIFGKERLKPIENLVCLGHLARSVSLRGQFLTVADFGGKPV